MLKKLAPQGFALFPQGVRRAILAFVARTASFLVDGFCFGGGAFVDPPPIGVGAFDARPTGCVLIGPVTGLPLGMLDN